MARPVEPDEQRLEPARSRATCGDDPPSAPNSRTTRTGTTPRLTSKQIIVLLDFTYTSRRGQSAVALISY